MMAKATVKFADGTTTSLDKLTATAEIIELYKRLERIERERLQLIDEKTQTAREYNEEIKARDEVIEKILDEITSIRAGRPGTLFHEEDDDAPTK